LADDDNRHFFNLNGAFAYMVFNYFFMAEYVRVSCDFYLLKRFFIAGRLDYLFYGQWKTDTDVCKSGACLSIAIYNPLYRVMA
jgi:hypothetical protein